MTHEVPFDVNVGVVFDDGSGCSASALVSPAPLPIVSDAGAARRGGTAE